MFKNFDEDEEKPLLVLSSRELKSKLYALVAELRTIKELESVSDDDIASMAVDLLATIFLTDIKNGRSN